MNALTSQNSPSRLDLTIHGMTCTSCAGRVEKALLSLPCVQSAQVNCATNSARIESRSPWVLADINSAITHAGFKLAIEPLTLLIKGMSCTSCAGRVENSLRKVHGVVSVTVNLASDTAYVEVIPGTSLRALLVAVETIGYTAAWPDADGASPGRAPVSLLDDPQLRAVLIAYCSHCL